MSRVQITNEVWVVNNSPDPMPPFYESTGPIVDRHFKLHDLIQDAWKADDLIRLEILCLEQIQNAPAVLAGEQMAAQMNGYVFEPFSALGYDRLSQCYYQAKRWQDVIRLHDEAASAGLNVDEMQNRVIVARRKLGIPPPTSE